MDVSDKRAVVLGRTSGIGLARSKLFCVRGSKVVAVSRSADRPDDHDGIALRKFDVRDEAALAIIFAAEAPFDTLVSSAAGGVRAFGPFVEMDIQGHRSSCDKLWGYAGVVRFGAPHLSATGVIDLVIGATAHRMKPRHIALSSVGEEVEAFSRSSRGAGAETYRRGFARANRYANAWLRGRTS
ncbi:MAG: hypothetical protein KKB37_05505 [Alphaproteobacteria bacterium]|nr:hypothetical protein [Alphaproteobacteria bacterium]